MFISLPAGHQWKAVSGSINHGRRWLAVGGSGSLGITSAESLLYWPLRPDHVHAPASVETYPFAASASASVQM